MAMTGPAISRAPISAAWIGDLPSSMCRKTFSTTTMASSTTRPMASTIASSVRRLMLKPEGVHQGARADQRKRDRHNRDQHRAHRAQEQEDHHDHDGDRHAKRPDHVVYRGLDELACVVGHVHLERWRQRVPDALKLLAHPAHHRQRVAAGVGCTPMKTAFWPSMETAASKLCASSDMVAMSFSRISAPSLAFTTISRN